jgi:protein-disulfide isomerase
MANDETPQTSHTPQTQRAAGPRLTIPVSERDHRRGRDDAPLTLLEYGDFECPQCRQAYPILRELERTLGDRLLVVFRHFPITNVHPHAQRAAESAEWAAARGLFWPMHDALYESSGRLSDGRLIDIAISLGVPCASLPESWAAHTFFGRVKEDFLSGLASGVTGTPAFFINGVRHEGGWDLDSLSRALDRAADQRSG